MIFGGGLILLLIGIFSVVQIECWKMFPTKFRDMAFANPVLAFVLNLGGSSLIAAFTGVASLVGVANMGASVVFGAYAYWYKKNKGIKGLGIGWLKLFGIIPLLPTVEVIYEKPGAQNKNTQ